jgi:hypothetical protein
MGDVLWLVGFALKIVEDGLKVVAARLWLSVLAVVVMVVLMLRAVFEYGFRIFIGMF